MGSGIGDSAIKSFVGLKQLFGKTSPQDAAVVEQMKEEAAEDPEKGARLAGEIYGGIAGLGKASSAVERTLRGAKALPGALRALGAGAGAAGATEFATAVGEGDDWSSQMSGKLKSALKAAGISGALGGAARLIARPFRPSKEAQELMDKDITPTLQQGSESPVGKFIGGMSGGAGATSVAKRQNEETLRAFLKRVDPNVDTKDMKISEMVGVLEDNLNKQYDTLYAGKKFVMSKLDKAQIWKAAQKAAGNEPDAAQNLLRELGETGVALRSGNTINLGQGGMQAQRQMIQDRINRYGGDQAVKSQAVRDGLLAAKAKFDEIVRNRVLTPEELARLSDLDSRYGDFSRFAEAARNPQMHKQFKVDQLMQSYAKNNPYAFARSKNQAQEEVLEPAQRVLNLAGQDDTRASLVAAKRVLAPLAAPAALGAAGTLAPALAGPLALGYGASLAGQTKVGAKALFGQYDQQRALEEFLRKGRTAPVGASLVTEE